MIRILGFILTAVALIACSSLPAKKDTKLSYQEGNIGVDKDDKIVIQELNDLSSELKDQKLINFHLNVEVKNERAQLERCYKDLADPRLGGSGDVDSLMVAIGDTYKVKSIVTDEVIIDKDTDKIKVLRKEDYLAALKNEKDRNKSLNKEMETIVPLKKTCENKLSAARVKAGLPADRYFDTKNNRMEKNLDDAFRFKEEDQKAKAKE